MDNLALMCAIAFVGVFLLLTVLSILMAALTALFPARPSSPARGAEADADAALVAAITTTMNQLYPGGRVSEIEEVR